MKFWHNSFAQKYNQNYRSEEVDVMSHFSNKEASIAQGSSYNNNLNREINFTLKHKNFKDTVRFTVPFRNEPRHAH